MAVTRTQQQILARIAFLDEKELDFFGAGRSDLIEHLDYEHAQEWLKPDVTAERWAEVRQKVDDPVDAIKDYMPFAWEKANGERGLSASRTINHMCAWLWLAGEDDLLAFAEDEDNYAMYGKPILRRICEHYGLPVEEYEIE